MSIWLLKTEPDEYSLADLQRDGVAEWDGVTNAVAQRNMRSIAQGDICVVYHTGNERSAVGLASVARGPYPDPTDPRGKRVWVDLRAGERLERPVTLSELRAEPAYADSPLLRMGRLSVVPLAQEQLDAILRLANEK